MICGYCGVDQHARCTGLLHTEFGFCACSDRAHGPIVQASRPCEQCPKLAWQDGPARADGVVAFMCSSGHLALVTPQESR